MSPYKPTPSIFKVRKPKVLHNIESIEGVRKDWFNSRSLTLEIGVKAHIARQVVLGRLICGRKTNVSLVDQSKEMLDLLFVDIHLFRTKCQELYP